MNNKYEGRSRIAEKVASQLGINIDTTREKFEQLRGKIPLIEVVTHCQMFFPGIPICHLVDRDRLQAESWGTSDESELYTLI